MSLALARTVPNKRPQIWRFQVWFLIWVVFAKTLNMKVLGPRVRSDHNDGLSVIFGKSIKVGDDLTEILRD